MPRREQRSGAADDVAKHCCADDHRARRKHAFRIRLRDEIAITDRSHGGERPIHCRDIRCSDLLPCDGSIM
eukprot:4617524-Prymnesium_polylepis.1